MPNQNISVGIFDTHIQAEAAVKEIKMRGLDIKKLSVVGKDPYSDKQLLGFYHIGEQMEYCGKTGAFWGSLWDLLAGTGFFWVPGVGPLLVAGPLVAMIAGAVEGAMLVDGLSDVGAGMMSLGIPKDNVLKYETFIKNGHYILIFHGTAKEVDKTRHIIEHAEILETTISQSEQKIAG